MYTSVTHDIQVTVMPRSCPTGRSLRRTVSSGPIRSRSPTSGACASSSSPATGRSPTPAAASRRVRGLGVVGEQPILKPGESFRYTSGCPLQTPSGIMTGSYSLIDDAERSFEVEIPAFSLDSPHARRVLN